MNHVTSDVPLDIIFELMQKNVLLIDDDPDDADIFSAALGEIDMKPNLIFVGNGVNSLNRLLQSSITTPDVIFLDINMPVVNGWECLRELKNLAQTRSIPVVMYSTMDIEKEGSIAMDIGAAELMTKPARFDELKQKLVIILQRLFPKIDP